MAIVNCLLSMSLVIFVSADPARIELPQQSAQARAPAESAPLAGVVPPLYPATTSQRPEIASPAILPDKREVVVVRTRDDRWGVVPVTVENSAATVRYGSRAIGKGRQLEIDGSDFPTLANTGLHAESELCEAATITGREVAEITRNGRPHMASSVGFMADDEDIISVLVCDNRIVRQLGLTHPTLARPLFHLWNLVLREYELGQVGRTTHSIAFMVYHGVAVQISAVHPTRGFQESIFDDEVVGAFEIELHRDLAPDEERFLRDKYPQLTDDERTDLVARLTRLHTGEMEPYYVMRYGFYEGHTTYRVDPVAIACIFGLRSLKEIEAAFPGQLHEVLTSHFTPERLTATTR